MQRLKETKMKENPFSEDSCDVFLKKIAEAQRHVREASKKVDDYVSFFRLNENVSPPESKALAKKEMAECMEIEREARVYLRALEDDLEQYLSLHRRGGVDRAAP